MKKLFSFLTLLIVFNIYGCAQTIGNMTIATSTSQESYLPILDHATSQNRRIKAKNLFAILPAAITTTVSSTDTMAVKHNGVWYFGTINSLRNVSGNLTYTVTGLEKHSTTSTYSLTTIGSSDIYFKSGRDVNVNASGDINATGTDINVTATGDALHQTTGRHLVTTTGHSRSSSDSASLVVIDTSFRKSDDATADTIKFYFDSAIVVDYSATIVSTEGDFYVQKGVLGAGGISNCTSGTSVTIDSGTWGGTFIFQPDCNTTFPRFAFIIIMHDDGPSVSTRWQFHFEVNSQ